MNFRWFIVTELICLGIGSNVIVVEQTVIVPFDTTKYAVFIE
jgi:hypothetical protein